MKIDNPPSRPFSKGGKGGFETYFPCKSKACFMLMGVETTMTDFIFPAESGFQRGVPLNINRHCDRMVEKVIL